jgi:hypothetical protein
MLENGQNITRDLLLQKLRHEPVVSPEAKRIEDMIEAYLKIQAEARLSRIGQAPEESAPAASTSARP